MDVYINDVAAFLPNDPIDNEHIEQVLGKVGGVSSKAKRIVLRNNKIEQRYYALDPATGNLTHTNAQLVAEAIKRLNPYPGFQPNHIQCLCCGTTGPDLLFPGMALMAAGELELNPCETVSTAGICIAGMTALKYAYMSVGGGFSHNAVSTGSELSSSFMRAAFFKPGTNADQDVETNPILAFDADFLRWMLSDGAGAAFLSSAPNSYGLTLKIEWIEHISYSGSLETCMYGGGVKLDDGSIAGWRQTENIPPDKIKHLMAVKQDIKLLNRHIVETMTQALTAIAGKHQLTANSIDWFLPHYSSAYFRDKFYQGMKQINFTIPYKKWFTNLPTCGNTGSAAIYIILADILHNGNLKGGERILCFVPESGRFSHCFMLLTVC